jgi:hypothetical protein
MTTEINNGVGENVLENSILKDLDKLEKML